MSEATEVFHNANGLDINKTYKKCRGLVEKMKTLDVEPASRVWMRSTDKATTTPVKGSVEGEIPSWLEGNLLRDGPGVLNIGDTWYHHVFDGMAVLHKFSIKNSEATYMSRILESDSYMKNTSANRIVIDEFGTRGYPDPCKTTLQRFMSKFTPPDPENITDNCAVNVCYFGDQLFAMTETNKIRRVDPDTLHTIGDKTILTDYVAVNMATAHPHVDPDGTVYNMGTSFKSQHGPVYNIVQFPPGKKTPEGTDLSAFDQASVVASIPCHWKLRPCYYHSFSQTDNYFVFVEQPLAVNIGKLVLNHYKNKAFMKAMDWFPKEKTRFRVVRRSDGEVLKTVYQADCFFTFHQINAYEDNGHLIVDLCCFEDGEVVNQVWIENILNPKESFNKALQAIPRRYILPLNTEHATVGQNLITLPTTKCKATPLKSGSIHCEPEKIAEILMEMPRINYRFNGKRYEYLYGFIPTKGLNAGTLCKVNAQTGETLQWTRPDMQVSEPVFVERPGATEEDDGVVLASLLNEKENKEVLMVVLDGKTFKELALVTFKTSGVVTKEFHGLFARDGDKVHRY